MDVSIIIVNWNTRDILKQCLKSVYLETCDISFETIVIDNASSDGSCGMVKKEFPKAILIENSENKGFAAANNQGMAVAKGRYILLLNSDTIIINNAINKIVDFADYQRDAAVFGCRVLNPDMTLQQTCFMFPSVFNMLLSGSYLYKIFPGSRLWGRERMSWWNRNDTRQVDVVTGCFMLTRRRAIEDVGFMDERFFMYGEETDWCYRFREKGWKVLFTPSAQIIHLGGQSTKEVKADMIVQLRLSILQFIRKHQGWLKHKIACFLSAGFFLVRLPIWFTIAVFVQSKKTSASIRFKAYLNGFWKVLSTAFA